MPNLKSLKTRIKSVKNTRKITKAMQMVAASKLRRAQERAVAARPYAEKMERMLSALAGKAQKENAPALLAGRIGPEGEVLDRVHLLVVATSDRGLCGGFNSSIVRAARQQVASLRNRGKQPKLMVVGKKGYEQLRFGYDKLIVERIDTSHRKQPGFGEAEEIARKIIALFEEGEIDSCSIVYNRFVSPLVQKVSIRQLLPLEIPAQENPGASVYEYEPEEEEVLKALLPRNIAVQIYGGLLENAASEQGARMTAMDNATRNAGEMIGKLTLVYNRTRQAAITRELIEIISGAEAL